MGDKVRRWTAENIEKAKAVLARHHTVAAAVTDVSREVGFRVTLASLANAFITRGLAPAAFVAAPEFHPVTVAERKDRARDMQRELDRLVKELRSTKARQAFIEAASSSGEPPRLLPRERQSGMREMAAVVLASDWHVEEPVTPESVAHRNEYNLEIAGRRVERFFQSIIWNIEHHRASKRVAIHDLILWLGGDLMTGYIHPEFVETNALSPTETVRWLLPRLRQGIRTLLAQLDLASITIPCSYGNHGRSTDKPRVSTGYANSYEWLMYVTLADTFEDRRVRFEITPSAHQYVEAYDWTLHFNHGDTVKYYGGVGGLAIPLLKAVPMWDLVKHADVHCIGHFHQMRDFGRAVANGSLIGYGPYSQHIRAEFEVPQQLMFYVDRARGKCMPTALWVDEDSSHARQMPRGRSGG